MSDNENIKNKMVDYSFYIQAPELFPVELLFADFLLDKKSETYYSYPKLFVIHKGHTTRIGEDKPLPYRVDMVWYSVTENKFYSLEQDLPYDMLKSEINGINGASGNMHDGVLLTLEPYGVVNLYAYNSIVEKKKLLASYYAKEETYLSLKTFREYEPLYEDPSKPVKSLQEYQLNALAYFSRAAEYMAENNYVMPQKDFDFWKHKSVAEYKMIEQDKINGLNEDGEKHLIAAVRQNKASLVLKLLVAGADLNVHSEITGETALSAACSMGYLHFANQLIIKGADLNLPEKQSGMTPLMLSSKLGNENIVDLLIKSGADVNARQFMYGQDIGYNALKYAKENNNQKIVDMLVQAGAEEIAEESTETAEMPTATTIENAVMFGDVSKVKELLAEGANPNAEIEGLGSVLYYAVATANIEIVKALLEAKADVNTIDLNGNTPLMLAISTEQAEIVKVIMEYGPDLSVKNKMGEDVVAIAENLGNKEVIKIIDSYKTK